MRRAATIVVAAAAVVWLAATVPTMLPAVLFTVGAAYVAAHRLTSRRTVNVPATFTIADIVAKVAPLDHPAVAAAAWDWVCNMERAVGAAKRSPVTMSMLSPREWLAVSAWAHRLAARFYLSRMTAHGDVARAVSTDAAKLAYQPFVDRQGTPG